MVRSTGFVLVALTLTMLLSAVADAAPGQGKAKGARPQGKGNGPQIPAEVLKKFDKDGDGKLNDTERAAAKKAMGERGGRPGQPGGEVGRVAGAVRDRVSRDGSCQPAAWLVGQ